MELDRQREVYREFARAGSTLFFLVETMKVLNRVVKRILVASSSRHLHVSDVRCVATFGTTAVGAAPCTSRGLKK